MKKIIAIIILSIFYIGIFWIMPLTTNPYPCSWLLIVLMFHGGIMAGILLAFVLQWAIRILIERK